MIKPRSIILPRKRRRQFHNLGFVKEVAQPFILEAMVLVGVIAYLLSKWGVSRMSWQWFVILALLGSIAFALPVVLLWKLGKTRSVALDA